MGLLYFAFYGAAAAWAPLLNVYLQQTGLSGLQIGTLSGMRPAIGLLGKPLWGVVADTWGRRRTLLLLLPLSGALILGYLWNGGFWYFLLFGALYTFLAAPIGALLDSLALDQLEAHPHLSFGRLRVGGAIGWALMALIIGRVIADWDTRPAFAVAAGGMMIAALLVWRVLPESGGKRATLRGWHGAAQLLRNRNLLAFLCITLLLHLGTAPIGMFYGIFMKENLGASSQLLGMAFGLRALSEVPVYIGGAAVIRRIAPRRALLVALLVYATQAFLYSVIHDPALGALVEVMHGPSFGLLLIVSVNYVSSQVPAEWRATGQTLYATFSGGLGGILGGAWGGFLYDYAGVRGMFRISAGVILLLALVAAVVLRGGATAGE
jgi:PPP family 3-phenylpropionic acid transporter